MCKADPPGPPVVVVQVRRGQGPVETGRWSRPGEGAAGGGAWPSARVDGVWKGISAEGTTSEGESVENYHAGDPGGMGRGMNGEAVGAKLWVTRAPGGTVLCVMGAI